MFNLLPNTPDERKYGLAALGMGMSQLAAGQPVNLQPAMGAMMERKERADMKRAISENPFVANLPPEQRAILASMPPNAAMSVISNMMFREPAQTSLTTFEGPGGVEYSFNPATGETKPLTDAETPKAEPRVTLVGPDDPSRATFGLPDDGMSYEVKYNPDTMSVLDYSIPGGRPEPVPGYTAGWEAVDKGYAPEYLSYTNGAGADAASQAAAVGSVLEKLEAGEPLTGPLVGITPDLVRAITDPEAQDAKERVESVVQRSLKETLGAQFTEREGERLIARAYNPSLRPEQNAARLRALFAQLEIAAKAKAAKAQYFSENGTLKGWTPLPIPSVDDMLEAMEVAAPSGAGGTMPSDDLSPEERRYLGLDD